MPTSEFKNWIDVDLKSPNKYRYYTFYAKRVSWYDPTFVVVLGYYDGKYVYTIKENFCFPYRPIAYKESEVQQYLEPFE